MQVLIAIFASVACTAGLMRLLLRVYGGVEAGLAEVSWLVSIYLLECIMALGLVTLVCRGLIVLTVKVTKL